MVSRNQRRGSIKEIRCLAGTRQLQVNVACSSSDRVLGNRINSYKQKHTASNQWSSSWTVGQMTLEWKVSLEPIGNFNCFFSIISQTPGAAAPGKQCMQKALENLSAFASHELAFSEIIYYSSLDIYQPSLSTCLCMHICVRTPCLCTHTHLQHKCIIRILYQWWWVYCSNLWPLQTEPIPYISKKVITHNLKHWTVSRNLELTEE